MPWIAQAMLMDVLAERKVRVFGIGKIHDIYNGAASKNMSHQRQCDGMDKLTALSATGRRPHFRQSRRFRYALWPSQGCPGFRQVLEEFDRMLGDFLAAARASDFADHYRGPRLRSRSRCHHHRPFPRVRAIWLTRLQLALCEPRHAQHPADMDRRCQNFGAEIPHGTSFLREISGQFAGAAT